MRDLFLIRFIVLTRPLETYAS